MSIKGEGSLQLEIGIANQLFYDYSNPGQLCKIRVNTYCININRTRCDIETIIVAAPFLKLPFQHQNSYNKLHISSLVGQHSQTSIRSLQLHLIQDQLQCLSLSLSEQNLVTVEPLFGWLWQENNLDNG